MDEVGYVHSISEAHRLLPSASRWNSIEIDFGLHRVSEPYESLPSNYSKSFDFNLVVADKQTLKRFIYGFIFVVALIIGVVLLLVFLPHKHDRVKSPKDLGLAVNQALTFFDAQKSGPLLNNQSVSFRSDSGLHDGNSSDGVVDLVGGFYDSGNNIKFGFPTAYTVTLLSWSVIEYQHKYADINELDHVKDIIRWGSVYLNKTFVPSNSTSDLPVLYSQASDGLHTNSSGENDVTCWQRPEDMEYQRPVSRCTKSASDLAGETAAALASASLVFRNEKDYSEKLVQAAEELFAFATVQDNMGIYTADEKCGAEAQMFYNSSGYYDELAWAGVWLYFATGNDTYLTNATDMFKSAMQNELAADSGVFYWNNKLPAVAVNYLLGNNPLKMSYMVGYGDNYPTHVHHRAASIRWDSQHYSCAEGDRWLYSQTNNPNVLIGAMVGGPDKDDEFLDMRNASRYTEPSISGNAGLVAALIALHESTSNLSNSKENNQGVDPIGIFANLR
ncbi:hypothetical protein ACLOJK_016701 [Asimina triloba]